MSFFVEFVALVQAIASAPPVVTAIGVAYLIVQDRRRGRQLSLLTEAVESLRPSRRPPPPSSSSVQQPQSQVHSPSSS